MNERDALLATVRAHPDEDPPRLVLADWYQDNDRYDKCEQCEGLGYYYPLNPIHQRGCPQCSGTGRVPNHYAERAEFIRLQIKLANLEHIQFGCDGSDERRGAKHRHGGKAGEVIHGVPHITDPRIPHHHHDKRCHDPRPKLRRHVQKFLKNYKVKLQQWGSPLWERGFISQLIINWYDWDNYYKDIIEDSDVVLRKVHLATWPSESWWAKETDLPALSSGYIQNDHITEILIDRFSGHCPYHPLEFTLPGDYNIPDGFTPMLSQE